MGEGVPPGEQGPAWGPGREEAGREGVWRAVRLLDSHVTVGMSLHLPEMSLLMNCSAVLKSRKFQKSFLLQVYS